MNAYDVLIYSQSASSQARAIQDFFSADLISDLSSIDDQLSRKAYRAFVMEGSVSEDANVLGTCERIIKEENYKSLPLVLLTDHYSLEEKIKAFEAGFDDYVCTTLGFDEISARVTKSIFHAIANEQLTSHLEMAAGTAKSAMADNSDLGASIQFLLAVHECDNLDQLGLQFFSAIERYGLKCSLQMRSVQEIKNMDAHGMEKDLESQLLRQLKDSDRYIDFGRRTIINFDRVSVLVKNMPVDDPERYGAIKDNTFCLVQGMNARVLAIEEHVKLADERESLKRLSKDVEEVVGTVKISYQKVMKEIAAGVDLAVAKIEDRVPHLALTERDEVFIEDCLTHLVSGTTTVFNEGLKVDEVFERLEGSVKHTLSIVEEEQRPELVGNKLSPTSNGPGGDSVELF